jgi:hypothetical protein
MFKNFILIIISLAMFSCGSISVSNGRQKVTVKPQQPPCDIHRKEIDPNCKIESKNTLPKQHP